MHGRTGDSDGAGVRPIAVRDATRAEIDLIVGYFHDAEHEFLRGMGIAVEKMPPRAEWIESIRTEMDKPLEERAMHFLTWLAAGEAVGHSSVNKIRFGVDAYMHLHLWSASHRRKGLGTRFAARSAQRYCRLFELTDLFCEPYALNPAPNRTLKRAGFEFVEEHEPAPGYINFPQAVSRWRYPCVSS